MYLNWRAVKDNIKRMVSCHSNTSTHLKVRQRVSI